MNSFRYFLKLSILAFVLSCSKDNNQQNPVVNSLSSTNSFIGDTLTLTGTNLNQIGNISLFNEDINEVFSDQATMISKTDTEIKFIVPELRHEKATIYFGSNIDPIDIELYGYIPYSFRSNGTVYRNLGPIQILDDNIAYCYHNNFDKIYKLSDKYTDLEELGNIDINPTRYYYDSENSGWYMESNFSEYNVYSFEDNINNSTFEYSIDMDDINQEAIRFIKYLSSELAYIMNYQGELFKVENGIVTPFSSIYPELSNTPYMTDSYSDSAYHFELLDDNSVLIAPTTQNYLIRIGNNGVNVLYSDDIINFEYYSRYNVNFIGNAGGFYSNQKMYRSNDYGQTWTTYDLNLNMTEYDNIFYIGGSQLLFFDNNEHMPNTIKSSVYLSVDNGQNWKRIIETYDQPNYPMMHNNYGLSSMGRYGLTKFRKFPDDF